MVLGFTQPLAEVSAREIPRGIALSAIKADNLTSICEPIV
jgi:hypothetical protein